jgi:predicted nuclease of predicted toxin-antitoxin system
VRFVANESCDFSVVRALRAAGHDVVAIAEVFPRISDDEVLKLARDDRRVLLTEDKDFGELVYASASRSCGVILFRFRSTARASMPAAALDAIGWHAGMLASRFTVVQPGRIRTGGSAIR